MEGEASGPGAAPHGGPWEISRCRRRGLLLSGVLWPKLHSSSFSCFSTNTVVALAGWWCARAAEAAEDPEGRGGPHEDTDGIDPCEAAAADRVFTKVVFELINVLFMIGGVDVFLFGSSFNGCV